MVRVALWVAPAKVPEMAIDLVLVTKPVETMKVALSAPAGTVTLAGTEATVVSALESVTTAPLPDTGPFISTVPWEVDPPTRELGFSETAFRASGLTRSAAAAVAVAMLNEAEVEPPGTMTLEGTEATAGLLLESGITVPPAGAAVGRVTLP